ncbi:Cell division and transport-associated protein TolR (TC 2.C.1.2.1) [Modicisalibacter ilicicola DSM 19980]|uniref:Tol-Pal system protein TolR n=1 Tax=Modicisalibacter ilicicola DSM 19980 TaxID=1121942 RepID=A0A1M4XE41_9GAMM|nr:protein TolR [Halomonas ilicicola]SHE91774.1 Cell division and transport-associated protein TolR (TC 2.C.1.2.1) [Halomonas ilicicola DSM 19980]
MHGPFNRGPGRKPMGEINVVPFIDVMLVLLVIFMITAPMLTQGVQVDLPRVTSEPIESMEDREPITVTIDEQGRYYISLGDELSPVPLDDISNKVIAVLERRPDTPVLVKGHRNVPYGQVVTLMSTLQTAGVPNVGLISEPPPSDS